MTGFRGPSRSRGRCNRYGFTDDLAGKRWLELDFRRAVGDKRRIEIALFVGGFGIDSREFTLSGRNPMSVPEIRSEVG
jgi:hypothetical protein